MPKKHPARGSSPLRRSRRFHPHAEALASNNPVSPSYGKGQVPLPHRHQSPKAKPSCEAKKTRQTDRVNVRRGLSGKGGDANARVPRRSARLNHSAEEERGAEEAEGISREEKKDRAEAAERRRGRSKGSNDSSHPVVAISLPGINEGEPRKELRRSHRRTGLAAAEINDTEPSGLAAEVVSGVEAQATVERNRKRKKRRQRGEAEVEDSTLSTRNASEVERTSKIVEATLEGEFPVSRKLRKLEGDKAISADNNAIEEIAVLRDNASEIPSNRQKTKGTDMTKPPIAACKKKAKKPTGDVVMANAGRNNRHNQGLGRKPDIPRRENKKGVAGGGTGKEGKGIPEWTSEEDKALHRAYIMARPSPHFWKNVSKMVSGKSAKECFNRIHSYLTTPPVPQPRAKVKKSEQSPIGHFSLSGGGCSSTFEEKLKKTRSTKQRKLLAQKTVRHILKKQSLQEPAQETDMFPIFQSSLNISAEELPTACMSPTPACQLKFSDSPKSGNGNLPTAKKSLPRRVMISPNEPSPEVLKQVKNLALHERYIDRLHGRVISWKPSSKLASSVSEPQGKENMMLEPLPIKAAKNALLFDAVEAMRQFRQSEDLLTSCAIGEYDDDDGDESNESESEDT